MARYTINLEGLEEAIVLKIAEQRNITINSTLEIILRDWVLTNHTKLMKWGIDPNQIGKELQKREKEINKKKKKFKRL